MPNLGIVIFETKKTAQKYVHVCPLGFIGMSIHALKAKKQILPQESKGKGTLKRLTKYMMIQINYQ